MSANNRTLDDDIFGAWPHGVIGVEDFLSTAAPTSAGPVAVGARSSQYTIALHAKYQALGIPQPLFNFTGASNVGWSAQVSFPGLDIAELQGIKDGSYSSSKQEAKERSSELALNILEQLEREGRITKMKKSVPPAAAKYVIELHDLHQKLGFPQPIITYTGSTAEGWSAQCTFPELDLEELKDGTRHLNKKEAKEALSKMALEAIETAIHQGKIATLGKMKKRSTQDSNDGPDLNTNYIGQLQEFQSANARPAPTYTDFAYGTRFACELELSTPPTNTPRTHGDKTALHTSKKSARQDAARRAIATLKDEGIWPEGANGSGIKKTKRPAQQQQQQQQQRGGGVVGDVLSSPPTSPPLPTASYAQRVATLASAMAFAPPEWRSTPSPENADFHSVACYFRGGGMHGGPIGEVRNVFGKKRAREECARLTLGYLEEVREKRVAYGMQVLGEMSGGGGVRVKVEEEGGDEDRNMVGEGARGVDVKVEENDDEGDEFEDAVETFRA
ncbi:hypothetical protein GQ44DRAFT_824203 [Phaeosphaeriaceae sp. PMI808]|nr:hypothetical protein GQ44DRAFT_824203 [Phaeosphaeriaceae sp. PMI808]